MGVLPIINSTFISPAKKKKKKSKREKIDEFDKMKQEAIRLSLLSASSKPYVYRPEGVTNDSKIIKFNKVPKN
jgi:lipoate synthase